MGDITYNGITVDPSPGGPHESRDAQNTNYIYVQGHDDLTWEQKDELEALKVEFQEYIGNNAYLCRYVPTDLAPIRDKPFVRAANTYHRVFKLSPDLQDAFGPKEVDIVLHKQANTAEAVAPYLDEVGVRSTDAEVTYRKIRVEATPQALAQIQQWESVKQINPVLPNRLYNDQARVALQDNIVTAANGGSNAGQGQIVAVNDSGFDLGAAAGKILPATVPAPFEGRIVAVLAGSSPRARNPPQSNDISGHGTHVCGSVAGDGESATMGGAIQGTAPKASLVVTSWQGASGPRAIAIPADPYKDLFDPPFTTYNAFISTNSFGQGAFSSSPPKAVAYTDGPAANIDSFVWDNPQCLILFAAGNDGQTPGRPPTQIGDWAGAKNSITVGATMGSRPSTNFAFDPGAASPSSVQNMASYSSRGPTPENRVKPDVVAPGTAILSTSSQDPKAASSLQNFGPTSDSNWRFDSGTSMATPLVAGCCAVIRQALISAGTATPSAALVKALLINGALASGETSTSAKNAKSAPNGASGFGFVNVNNTVLQISSEQYVDIDVSKGLDDRANREYEHSITLPEDKPGLKVTLAYSDRPGARLQNKLRLSILNADNTRIFDSGQENFAKNNVQQIIAHNVESAIKISVQVIRIARTDDKQPFALAWQFVE